MSDITQSINQDKNKRRSTIEDAIKANLGNVFYF